MLVKTYQRTMKTYKIICQLHIPSIAQSEPPVSTSSPPSSQWRLLAKPAEHKEIVWTPSSSSPSKDGHQVKVRRPTMGDTKVTKGYPPLSNMAETYTVEDSPMKKPPFSQRKSMVTKNSPQMGHHHHPPDVPVGISWASRGHLQDCYDTVANTLFSLPNFCCWGLQEILICLSPDQPNNDMKLPWESPGCS